MSYSHDDVPKTLNTNWMRDLPDDVKLSELSIPGAHDACCRVKIVWAQNQSWSLYDLLKAGVRFVDIRCRHYENKFIIHHGIFYLNLNFNEVIENCIKFLEENPSEFILMKIQEEYKPYNNNRSFAETFDEYYKTYINYFNLSSKIPCLGEIRKKIWVLKSFSYKEGYPWEMLNIQDLWDLGETINLDEKKAAIKNQLDSALTGDKNILFANHCTATGVFRPPNSVAKETNGIAFNYKGRLGIIIFDFPGEDIIKHVINQNFIKFEKKKNIIQEIPLSSLQENGLCIFIRDNKLIIETTEKESEGTKLYNPKEI